MSADRPIDRCLPQINCLPGQSSSNICVTTITPARQRCNQASPGYFLNSGVVRDCIAQSNCSQHLSNQTCIGVNNNLRPCGSPSPGYEINNGIVNPRRCLNVNMNPHPTTSRAGRSWGAGNCLQELQSGGNCQPSCSSGHTITGKTSCSLGTLTRARCVPNSCNSINQSSPNRNPHSSLGTQEYNAWSQGNCGASLSSGNTCQPICSPSTQFISIPNQSSCFEGNLTSMMCQKRPCPSGTPIDINVSTETSLKRITLKNQMVSDSTIVVPCGGDAQYTELSGWRDKYDGNITLTCDKGTLSNTNTCAFFTACSTPFKTTNCEMGTNGICNVISRTQTCDCNSSSAGTGYSPGPTCRPCVNATKNICHTHVTQNNCHTNCKWVGNASSTPCQVTPSKQIFLQNGCICNPGYYSDTSRNTCSSCFNQANCLTHSLSDDCIKPSTNFIKKCIDLTSPSRTTHNIINGVVTPRGCNVSSPTNGNMGTCSSILQLGSSCQPQCSPGYTSSGFTTCLSGTLTQTTCNENRCTPTPQPVPTNGSRGACPNELLPGSTCAPSCNQGYQLVGHSSCSRGVFTPAVCTPGPCSQSGTSPVRPPLNGQIGDCPSTMISGQTCNQICNFEYSTPSPQRGTCNRTVFTPIQCIQNKCLTPSFHSLDLVGLEYTNARPTSPRLTSNELKQKTNVYRAKYYMSSGDYNLACNTDGGQFSVSNPPTMCIPQDFSKCEKGERGMCNSNTGKLECTEQFTGTIEGFRSFEPQDYKCSIRNYDICKNFSSPSPCNSNQNCIWRGYLRPTPSPPCQINHGQTFCKSLSSPGMQPQCDQHTSQCKWNVGWVRGGETRRGGCSENHHLTSPNKICSPNSCVCDQGTAKSNTLCNHHQDNQCISCNPGYRLVDYENWAKNQSPPPSRWFGSTNTIRTPNINLSTISSTQCRTKKCKCIPNQCNCPDGIARDGRRGDSFGPYCYRNDTPGCRDCSINRSKKLYFNRYCQPLCNISTQYVSQPVTISTDTGMLRDSKGCGNLRSCQSNQYEFREPQTNSEHSSEKENITDRECRQLTDPCCSGKLMSNCKLYESPSPSGISGNGFKTNRICSLLDKCDSFDEYLSTRATWSPMAVPSGTYISNNICKKFKVCNEGEYTSRRPLKNTDQTLLSDRECGKLTNCLDGEFVVRKGGNDENRECGPCPKNTFSIGKNKSSCIAMEECGPGLQTNKKGTSKKNRTCKVCSKGKTSAKLHNDSCPLPAPPTKCFCKNGAPIFNCKQKKHNCQNCASGYTLKKIGDSNRCVDIQLSKYCNHGIITGSIDKGNAECKCIENHFGGGPWKRHKFDKCIPKIQCSCENGKSATNIPCGKGTARKCPRINIKGNPSETGKEVNITCLSENKPMCESCDIGFKLTKEKLCIKECPKNNWYDGNKCLPHTICSKDEYESVAPSEKNDRQCQKITKTCPQGEFILKEATRKSDTICSELEKQLKFMVKRKTKKPLKKCAPKDTNEITYNLCHLEEVKKFQVNTPKFNNYDNYILSIYSDNIHLSKMSVMMRNNFIRVLKDILYKKLLLQSKQDLILLSITGDNPLRLDVAIKDTGGQLLQKIAKERNPIMLFRIVETLKTTKMYITGIRKS